MLKLPKQIEILGRTWKIEIDKNISDKCHGNCNYGKRTIKLTKGWADLTQVLGHELSHAFLFETNLMENEEGNASVLGLFLSDILNQIYFK